MTEISFEEMLRRVQAGAEVEVRSEIESVVDQNRQLQASGKIIASTTAWKNDGHGMLAADVSTCAVSAEQANLLVRDGAHRIEAPVLRCVVRFSAPYDRGNRDTEWTVYGENNRKLRESTVRGDPTGAKAAQEARTWVKVLLDAAGHRIEAENVPVEIEAAQDS